MLAPCVEAGAAQGSPTLGKQDRAEDRGALRVQVGFSSSAVGGVPGVDHHGSGPFLPRLIPFFPCQ